MSLPVVLRVEAQADFDEAFDWYEAQRAGLGTDFAAAVQQVFDRISVNPPMYAERGEPLHAQEKSGSPGSLRRHYRQKAWGVLMAQATLVEMHIKDGQRLIDRLTQAGVAVTAAAWVKESESGDWYLYLATPLVTDEGGKRPAYHRVNEVIRELQKEGFGMDPFAKKVIGPHDPIAADLVANRNGRPGGPPTPFRRSRLGDLAVEEAFIYLRPSTE